jgi:glyoxylate utilization-related uncharacterized protein
MITPLWYEVWVDEGILPPYLLLLIFSEGKYSVYDPVVKSVVFASDSYESARVWLLEDEYTKVEGRMIPTD